MTILRHSAITKLRRATVRDYASWTELYEWDHFAGLTFRVGLTPERVLGAFKIWVRRLEQRAQRRVCWCVALDRHMSGELHLHCLIYAAGALPGADVQRAWSKGWSRLARFRHDVGGAAYVLKTLDHPDAEYDFSRYFPPLRVPSAA